MVVPKQDMSTESVNKQIFKEKSDTEKRSEEHLPSSNESKEKHKHTNDKEIGTVITKYTGQRKINERHSIERVWHSAGREPSDTLPGSQPCTQKTRSIYHIPYS